MRYLIGYQITGQPWYSTNVRVQHLHRAAYPIRVISKVSFLTFGWSRKPITIGKKLTKVRFTIKIFFSNMSCGYISLVLAYFYQKLNYSEYLKHKKTINIRVASGCHIVDYWRSDSREKTLKCVRSDKSCSFRPYFRAEKVNCKIAYSRMIAHLYLRWECGTVFNH